MYPADDPRASLAGPKERVAATDFGSPQFGRFYATDPQLSGIDHKTWLTRGENFLCAYVEATAGHVFERTSQPDEYAVVVPDAGTSVGIAWAGGTTEVKGPALAFVPAGGSRVEVTASGRIAMFFTVRATDLLDLCSNNDGYSADPNVGDLQDWPEPVGGFKVRAYSLDFPIEKGKLGRIFRSTTLMVNFFDARNGPRDPSNLSPHDHDDFQQCSLVLDGTYVHHMRWPWLSNRNLWRDDLHERIEAPSITFIPAQVMHTSEASGPAKNLLIDIFCPPRFDFSGKPGWVLNADDYPAPEAGQ
jgi:hypothetical protein